MTVISQFRATHQQLDGKCILPYLVEYVFGKADLDGDEKYYIPVPAGSLVLGVLHLTTTAWDGTTPALDVGDGVDPDGFLADAVINAENALANSLTGGAALAAGKFYASSGQIVLAFNNDVTVGASKVYVLFAY